MIINERRVVYEMEMEICRRRSKMIQKLESGFVSANRDPSEGDSGYSFLWWNTLNNRFFRFMGEKEGKFVWEHLKESNN